ncbi:hypothetical protein A4A49_53075, partial [Nicotiana attenuata]
LESSSNNFILQNTLKFLVVWPLLLLAITEEFLFALFSKIIKFAVVRSSSSPKPECIDLFDAPKFAASQKPTSVEAMKLQHGIVTIEPWTMMDI